MWEKSIRKFVDGLNINSWAYYLLLLFLGITIFTTIYVNHKLKPVRDAGIVIDNENLADNNTIIMMMPKSDR